MGTSLARDRNWGSILPIYRKTMYGAIVGHQPVLSVIELLSVTKNEEPFLVDREFVLFEKAESLPSSAHRLGSIQKVFKVLGVVSKSSVVQDAQQLVMQEIQARGLSACSYAVSCYGPLKSFQKPLLLELKKRMKAALSGKVRFVHKRLNRNVDTAVLLSQHVLEKGLEVVCVHKGASIYVGVTEWVQDINAYTKRDSEKPVRDMHVGLLPPKLAQTMLNFSGVQAGQRVWDPFCGMGTIPMEALLMGVHVDASDVDTRMVEASRTNIAWMEEVLTLGLGLGSQGLGQGGVEPQRDVDKQGAAYEVWEADAQHAEPKGAIDVVVTEGWLGHNFEEAPSQQEQVQAAAEVALLWKAVIAHWREVLPKGTVCVCTLPWYPASKERVFDLLRGTFKHLEMRPLLSDSHTIAGLPGSVMYTKDGTYLYTRGKQFVGREIVRFAL